MSQKQKNKTFKWLLEGNDKKTNVRAFPGDLGCHKVIIVSENGTIYKISQEVISNQEEISKKDQVKLEEHKGLAGGTVMSKIGDGGDKKFHILDCTAFNNPGESSFARHQEGPGQEPEEENPPRFDFLIKTFNALGSTWYHLKKEDLKDYIWEQSDTKEIKERSFSESIEEKREESETFYAHRQNVRELYVLRDGTTDEIKKQLEGIIEVKIREYVQETIRLGSALSMIPMTKVSKVFRLGGAAHKLPTHYAVGTCYILNCKTFDSKRCEESDSR